MKRYPKILRRITKYRDFKVMKKPKFDITKLMELHQGGGEDEGAALGRPEAEEAQLRPHHLNKTNGPLQGSVRGFLNRGCRIPQENSRLEH